MNRKKSRLPKNKKPPPRRPTMGTREDLSSMTAVGSSNSKERFSIIRNREVLNDGYHSTGPPGMPSYQESSDEFYGVVSDSDIVNNERYRNDAKLRKRCAVVITPTKELIQYERKRDQMYNEILLKQRRKLEQRALEKQREKERRRLSRREESAEQIKPIEKAATSAAIQRDRDKKLRRKSRNYTEIFMSSESEFETNFQVRTRRQRQQIVNDLQPLNIQIEMTEATTTSLLSQIDAHLEQEPAKQTEKLPEERTKANTDEMVKDDDAVNEETDIKQKTCDINDKGQTKMRELNLLADIAQHLSPYQLDLPETTPTTPAPLTTEPTATTLATTSATLTEGPKEKVTVTEHIILQQSFDNLLEKTQTQNQLDINEQQQHAAATSPPLSYAHESKLNIAANYNSSPKANVLPQQNNTPPPPLIEENNDDSTAEPNKDSANTKQIDETLEQILEESISVLKSVTSPGNLLNECTTADIRAQTPPPQRPPLSSPTNCETTIPILISNVKSLNHFEQQQKKDKNLMGNFEDKTQHLLAKETVTMENGVFNTQTEEKTKDILKATTAKESQTGVIMSSTLLNNSETSLLVAAAADLSNISSETELTQTLKVPSLMTADLSDISLESEISKHLPDIAEPSPVVTDMSDNSNESNVSKTFISLSNTTTMGEVMSLPDLPLEMPTALPANPPPPQAVMESNFNNLNATLNTPTKLAASTNQSTPQIIGDLNTPLKFPLQPDLEPAAAPQKNVLEPEADNNVTKFLDLILNKTVTDAESETRDKIIKELNALTADNTATGPDNSESNNSNEETAALVSEISSELTANVENKSLEVEATELENPNSNLLTTAEEAEEEQQVKEDKTPINISLESLQTVEIRGETVKETPVLIKANEEQSLTPNLKTNNEDVNPPKDTNKEEQMPLAKTLMKMKSSSPLKQTFNIKCRVRLKRLNIDDHCKSSKKETWMAIPLTKPEETADKSANNNNNNDMINCDNTKTLSMIEKATTTTSSLIKKPSLKYNSKRLSEEEEDTSNKCPEFKEFKEQTTVTNPKPEDPIASKKAKLEEENINLALETTSLATAQQEQLQLQGTTTVAVTSLSPANLGQAKTKTKPLKTVTFDLSNLNEELRETTTSSSTSSSAATYQTPKHKTKNHHHLTANIAAGGNLGGCYLKNTRTHHKKLPDNTLRAAETLQLFVNTLNDSTRSQPAAEFNKKRSPIKNKCIAEDETPRPPPASTLMGTPPCKKSCTDKTRSQISSSKCKDQLVSSLPAPSISTITSDITTARIYTSSPLDQTLPEYDDNVDTVADTELILPTTTGSLRRKLKRPKKSLTRPEPADDTSTDDISNQPECNGEDDTDAVVDNEDDVFAEELLPIPAANEHILEEIVSARPTHMSTGTVIRDDYMNIEATATVPVYLFNDESRDLATPEPIQSSGDTTNVVDSSSYLNNSASPAAHNVMAAATASTTTSSLSSATSTALGNLEKSMLSPSEHEVSSTQETFYQTPTKSKQNGESFSEKSSSTSSSSSSSSMTKDKGGNGGMGGGSSSSSCSMMGGQKVKPDEMNFQNKQQEDHTSSTTGLLQNNQVDTTNHSPEMCTLALTPPTNTSTSTSMTNNRKMRKVSTHDEILFNELQQQQQQQHQQQQQQQLAANKRKNLTTTNTTTTTFCAESTSDHNNCKTKTLNNNNPEDNVVKSNGTLNKEDKFKKLLKEACKLDKNLSQNELEVAGGLLGGGNLVVGGSGGGSSPSTTTIINEDKISRSKRKKQKSSKSSKTKNHNERCTKIVLKASKLSAHVPATAANPLIITIPKSRILRPPATPTPPTPTAIEDEQEQEPQEMEEFLDIPNAKLFTEKEKDSTMIMLQQNSGSSSSSSSNQSQTPHHYHQHHLHPSTTNQQAQTLNSITKKEWHQTPAAASTKTKRSHSPVNNSKETLNLKSSNTSNNASKEHSRNSITNKEKSLAAMLTKNSFAKEKSGSGSGSSTASAAATTMKKKTKTSSINNHNNNSSSSSNNDLVFVKDKYDLIKSKEKSQQHHQHNNDLMETKEKLKDKSNSQQSNKLANTSTNTSSSSSNSRLHKSSSKDKLKDKQKINEKSNTQNPPLKFNISLSSSGSKNTNSASTAANNKTSNSKSSKSSSSNTSTTLNHTNVKYKMNLSTQSSSTTANVNDNNRSIQQQLTTPTSTSTTAGSSNSSSTSTSTSVTISTHHVRKKLKTK